MENIEQTVFDVIAKVAEEKGLDLKTPALTQKLVTDIGFKSIDLARIIAILEIKLSVDPFSKLVPITSIQTVGDLCDAYQLCFADDQDAACKPDFERSESRGEARLSSSRMHRGELRKKARTG